MDSIERMTDVVGDKLHHLGTRMVTVTGEESVLSWNLFTVSIVPANERHFCKNEIHTRFDARLVIGH